MSISRRRIITRICITVSFLCLLATVIRQAAGHRVPVYAIPVFAVAGILSGLAYLRSTRGRS